jgi:hypothetical protein
LGVGKPLFQKYMAKGIIPPLLRVISVRERLNKSPNVIPVETGIQVFQEKLVSRSPITSFEDKLRRKDA